MDDKRWIIESVRNEKKTEILRDIEMERWVDGETWRWRDGKAERQTEK